MVRCNIVAVAAVALLVACGGGGTTGGGASSTGPTGWNALDACATLGRDEVATLVGQPVAKTELSPGSPGDDVRAAFSTCTYDFPKGQLMLLTREAPDADATAESIERSRTADGTLPPAIDVPGLGRAALWSRESKGLQVFLDDRRYVSINFNGLPVGDDVQARAVAVAKALK